MSQTNEQLSATQGTLLAIGGILAACQAQLKQLEDRLKGLTVPVSENETPVVVDTPETGAKDTATAAETKADTTSQKDSEQEAASAPPTKDDVVSSLVRLVKMDAREKGLALLASLTPPCPTVDHIPQERYAYVIKEATRIGDELEKAARGAE